MTIKVIIAYRFPFPAFPKQYLHTISCEERRNKTEIENGALISKLQAVSIKQTKFSTLKDSTELPAPL